MWPFRRKGSGSKPFKEVPETCPYCRSAVSNYQYHKHGCEARETYFVKQRDKGEEDELVVCRICEETYIRRGLERHSKLCVVTNKITLSYISADIRLHKLLDRLRETQQLFAASPDVVDALATSVGSSDDNFLGDFMRLTVIPDWRGLAHVPAEVTDEVPHDSRPQVKLSQSAPPFSAFSDVALPKSFVLRMETVASDAQARSDVSDDIPEEPVAPSSLNSLKDSDAKNNTSSHSHGSEGQLSLERVLCVLEGLAAAATLLTAVTEGGVVQCSGLADQAHDLLGALCATSGVQRPLGDSESPRGLTPDRVGAVEFNAVDEVALIAGEVAKAVDTKLAALMEMDAIEEMQEFAVSPTRTETSKRPTHHSSLRDIPQDSLLALDLHRHEYRSLPPSPTVVPSLEDFLVIRPINSGAFGSVHLARKKLTGDVFAIKVLRKADVIKRKMVESVFAERNVMAVADSPFVVKLYYAFHSPKSLFLVMEYLDGGDLGCLLSARGCLSEDLTRIYMTEILLALDSLHKQGITHRDLKPENCVIARSGHIKITDFGLSSIGARSSDTYVGLQGAMETSDGSVRRRFTHEASVVGTPDYMAPELLSERGKHSIASDLWSTGIVMFELLTGCPPFNAETIDRVFSNISRGVVRWPVAVGSPSARAYVTQTLVRAASARLGVNGLDEVQQHPFFHGIPWEADALLRIPLTDCAMLQDTLVDVDLPAFDLDQPEARSLEDGEEARVLQDGEIFGDFAFKNLKELESLNRRSYQKRVSLKSKSKQPEEFGGA